MRILLLGIAIISLLIGCKSEKPVPLEKSTTTESIIIGGSASVMPIVKTLAQKFEARKPGVKIIFGASGHSGAGIRGVNSGVYAIGVVSRELKPEEKKLGLIDYWFARDALVFATHPTVNLKGLSSDELRTIYYGEKSFWKEFGGPDHDIVVLDRSMSSSPRVILHKEKFFDKKRGFASGAVVLESPDDMNIALVTTPYSIGFTSLASILREHLDLNILALDGIQPTPERVRDGSYILARPQGLVVNGEPTGLVKEFLDFIFSEKGRTILEKRGYVPLERGS